MGIRRFARIGNDIVVELLTTNADPKMLFHASLVWMEVTNQPNVELNWRYANGQFAPPPASTVTAAQPTVAELKARLDALAAQITVLTARP
jgi:hypothetical protein